MSTRNTVYKLKKELAFWQKLHEHEPMDKREFELEHQIRQLENRNEFGIPQYNGHIDDENYDNEYEYISPIISCRYCGKKNLKWKKVDDKWRLTECGSLHTCDAYKKHQKV